MGRTAMGGNNNPFLQPVANLAGQGVDTSSLQPFQQGVSNPFVSRALQSAQGQGAPGMEALANIAQGNQGPNPFQTQAAQAASQQNGIGMRALGDFASGQMMSNPYLDARFDQAARQVQDRVNAQMMQAGRSGSGAHQALMQRGLSDLGTQIYGGAYEQDMGRRLAAANTRAGLEQEDYRFLGQMGDNSANRQLQAAGQQAGLAQQAYGLGADLTEADFARQLSSRLSGIGQANNDRAFGLDAFGVGSNIFNSDFNNQLNAFNSLNNQTLAQNAQRLAASGQLPGVYDFANQGARDLMGVGSSLEGYEQALIDDQVNRYNYMVNAPRDLINWYNAIASGQGQLGGTELATGQMPYQASNPFLQGLGAVGTLASGIGALAPFFGRSDPRLKRDAKPIGKDARGVRWHEYAYLDDAPGTKRVGVMADELERIAPQFVHTGPDGFKMVDYGGLSAWEG